jgi:hypothetical protein
VRTFVPLALLAAAALAAACGNGAAPDTAPREPADHALLAEADFPPGWRPTPGHDVVALMLDVSDGCPAFSGYARRHADRALAEARSSVYAGGDGERVSSHAVVYPDAATAQQLLKLKAAALASCADELKPVWESAIAEVFHGAGHPALHLDVRPGERDFPRHGAGSVMLRFRVESEGAPGEFVGVDYLLLRAGRLVGAMTYDADSSADRIDEDLAAIFADRLREADAMLERGS